MTLTRRINSLLLVLFLFSFHSLSSQDSQLKEELESIPTYMFGDPDPVPIIPRRSDIYPYFRFDGYTNEKKDKNWKVITLKNDYITAKVLPEVGGKVWGIIENQSGEDYIYWNRVLKFRDIAMRGAWTSGGIEFNFGFIGHTPATATPVDYLSRTNSDGSVSCFIGGMDLPSRTEWRVEMRLPKDAAYLETHSSWYNATDLHHPYYYWSNSAVHTGDDLEFFYPGTHYIGHGGELAQWPIDLDGRNLALYRNNNFGPSKSYHILGESQDYKGVYWHNKDFGMGHYALHHELPGQKLWLWALSRSGGIWEDLLTDEQGQYVEVQAGRMFNQAAYSSGFNSPFGQRAFYPHSQDHWSEHWFPLKRTKGIHAASERAAISINSKGDSLLVIVMALQAVDGKLSVYQNGMESGSQDIDLTPLQSSNLSFKIDPNLSFRITFAGIYYNSDTRVQRPLKKAANKKVTASEMSHQGNQQFLLRDYASAYESYQIALEMDPQLLEPWLGLSEISLRKARLEEAKKYAKKALALNTYSGRANFLLGSILMRQGRTAAAREAYSIATKEAGLEAGALGKMAACYLIEGNLEKAVEFSRKSLKIREGLMYSQKVLITSLRRIGKMDLAIQQIEKLLEMDPLNHFARFEKAIVSENPDDLKEFKTMIQNELPHESYLELAVNYHNWNLAGDAVKVLKVAPTHPMVNFWLAYLNKDESYTEKALEASPNLIYPFRQESIPVLYQAIRNTSNWKALYYSGLLHWGLGNKEDAMALMNQCGNRPEFGPFYISRALLGKELLNVPDQQIEKDLLLAHGHSPEEWRVYKQLGSWYDEMDNIEESLKWLKEGVDQFPNNFNLELTYGSRLLKAGRFDDCLEILENIEVLPFEGASAGHEIYSQAHIFAALEERSTKKALVHLEAAREWPENLGVGKAYNPDESLIDFISARLLEKGGKQSEAAKFYQNIIDYKGRKDSWEFLSIYAARKLNAEPNIEEQLKGINKRERDWIEAQLNDPVNAKNLPEYSLDKINQQTPLNRFALLLKVLNKL